MLHGHLLKIAVCKNDPSGSPTVLLKHPLISQQSLEEAFSQANDPDMYNIKSMIEEQLSKRPS
jgi:hypothetical protein